MFTSDKQSCLTFEFILISSSYSIFCMEMFTFMKIIVKLGTPFFASLGGYLSLKAFFVAYLECGVLS